MIVVSCMVQTTKETLIQSQSQLLQEFVIHSFVIAFLKELAIRVSFIPRHI